VPGFVVLFYKLVIPNPFYRWFRFWFHRRSLLVPIALFVACLANSGKGYMHYSVLCTVDMYRGIQLYGVGRISHGAELP